jgi:hypothetical protein
VDALPISPRKIGRVRHVGPPSALNDYPVVRGPRQGEEALRLPWRAA